MDTETKQALEAICKLMSSSNYDLAWTLLHVFSFAVWQEKTNADRDIYMGKVQASMLYRQNGDMKAACESLLRTIELNV